MPNRIGLRASAFGNRVSVAREMPDSDPSANRVAAVVITGRWIAISRNSGTAQPSLPKAFRITGTPTNTVLDWPEAKPASPLRHAPGQAHPPRDRAPMPKTRWRR